MSAQEVKDCVIAAAGGFLAGMVVLAIYLLLHAVMCG